jgi:hypothetical protein
MVDGGAGRVSAEERADERLFKNKCLKSFSRKADGVKVESLTNQEKGLRFCKKCLSVWAAKG